MNNNQRVFGFSLAVIVCLVVVQTVSADEADQAKAAALIAEMFYPEYANSPEFQAFGKQPQRHVKRLRELDPDLRKRTPSSDPRGPLDSFGRHRPSKSGR